jgi:hypothetical protein
MPKPLTEKQLIKLMDEREKAGESINEIVHWCSFCGKMILGKMSVRFNTLTGETDVLCQGCGKAEANKLGVEPINWEEVIGKKD